MLKPCNSNQGGVSGRGATHLDTVLCPLGYVQMCIGDCQVWAMIDSGLMVNLLPKLVRNADLVRQQANIELRGIGRHSARWTGWWKGNG
ncbi:uncharacterized protein VP01_5629g1 [Puccinia sorghi]|uniref:Uncharacterized protein n=1 Tax=Puccinia sorghi TaxID=27349 RepID=A0A0L6UIY0_9BASI|nr:uncharacterized protein VP01_5629g1 [Puccinia sorghi]